jgi:hypothetical protein
MDKLHLEFLESYLKDMSLDDKREFVEKLLSEVNAQN